MRTSSAFVEPTVHTCAHWVHLSSLRGVHMPTHYSWYACVVCIQSTQEARLLCEHNVSYLGAPDMHAHGWRMRSARTRCAR